MTDSNLRVSFDAKYLNDRTYIFIPKKDYVLVAEDDGNYVLKDTNYMIEQAQGLLPDKENK